jgi:Mrp family chromosome partitioning ATPase
VSEFSQAIERASWLLREKVQRDGIRALVVCGASSPADSSFVTARLARDLQRRHAMQPLVVRLIAGDAPEAPPACGVERREIDCSDSQISGSASLHSSLAPVLAEAVGRHDIVLIDTPPLLHSVACLHAVSLVPHVLLVVEFGRTQEDTVLRAVRELQNSGAALVGTLISRRRPILPGWIDRMLGA